MGFVVTWRGAMATAVVGLSVIAFGEAVQAAPPPPYQIIYSFPDTTAMNPAGGLYRATGGILIGTTLTGGTVDMTDCPDGCGTVFALLPPNANRPTWTRTILHNFNPATEGGFPYSMLVKNKAGELFGSTSSGGPNGSGVVFRLTPPASGLIHWTFDVVLALDSTTGSGIYGDLMVDPAGAVYATTYSDGQNSCGTVLKLIPDMAPPGAAYTPQVIYDFPNEALGCSPSDGLVLGAHNTLFGTAYTGGRYGAGVVFQLKRAAGGGSYLYRALHHFTGNAIDGGFPVGTLALQDGTLYGVTAGDGTTAKPGTIYSVVPPPTLRDAADYKVIHRMKAATEGFNMQTGLTLDPNGVLYGLAYQKTGAQGALFTLTPPGMETNWTFQTLHTLTGAPDGDDPTSTLMRDNAGTFYGTTQYGGANDHGSVFTYTPPL